MLKRMGLCAFLCLVWSATLWGAEAVTPVKYVFLFIGDGFSIPQRMMAEEYLHKEGQEGLYLNTFPNQVLTTTRCVDSFITDSAAGGTAIACGTKTLSGRLGVDATGKRLVSVAEVARDAGRKVGIVTSVTINHATPAAFYGHNVSRGNGYELGLDLLASNFDYFAGGGIENQNDSQCKKFQGNIYDIAPKSGYRVVHKPDDVRALKPGCGKTIACLEKGALPYAIDQEDSITLAEYTQKGIELLDNPQGFFMMVEGGKIDWTCHANDAATVLWEIIAFDKAVRVARDFMKNHPEETLIVVTGDHETGGLTLGFAGTGYRSYIERLKYQKCSGVRFHEKLDRWMNKNKNDLTFENVQSLVTQYFGLKFTGEANDPMLLTSDEINTLKEAFKKSFLENKKTTVPFAVALLSCFDNKAGLGWTTNAHTALPVNTAAIGCNADSFKGMIDNTDIAKKLKQMVR